MVPRWLNKTFDDRIAIKRMRFVAIVLAGIALVLYFIDESWARTTFGVAIAIFVWSLVFGYWKSDG